MKCVNHPSTDSNSYCGQCGRPLCAECKREVSGTTFCESCLAGRLKSTLPPWGGGRGDANHSPGLGLALGFIPGVGAIYNGQFAKAISQVLIFGCLIALGNRVHSSIDIVFDLGAWAFYFYMVIDSFQTAKAKAAGQPMPEWFGLQEMKLNAPVGAALLIGLGVLFLLDNFGIPVIDQVGKLWPVLLIVAGFLLLQRRVGGSVRSAPPSSVQPDKPSSGVNDIPRDKGL